MSIFKKKIVLVKYFEKKLSNKKQKKLEQKKFGNKNKILLTGLEPAIFRIEAERLNH